MDLLAVAQKLVEIVPKGLCKGVGKPEPGRMCVEAAVCYAMGMDHGDEPKCVGSSVRTFKIRLNDSRWNSNKSRADGMIKLAIGQLGSDQIDQEEFSEKLSIKTVNTFLPFVFEEVGFEYDLSKLKSVKCLRLAKIASKDAAYASYATSYTAAAAHDIYAAHAANATASAYAYSADAYDTYGDYTSSNTPANTAAAAASGVKPADSDKILTFMADMALDVLIEMKSPGCEYLYLLEE